MSFDTFILWFLAILAVGYFLDKLGDAAKDIAKARLLEAELAEREFSRRHPSLPSADTHAT